MLDSRQRRRRTTGRLIAFLLGGAAMWLLARPAPRATRSAAEQDGPALVPAPAPARVRRPKPGFGRRLAVASAFVLLFAAGGALTAVAGDEVASLAQPDGGAAAATTDTSAGDPGTSPGTTDATTTEATSTDAGTTTAAPDPAPAPPAEPAAPAPPAETAPPAEPAPAAAPAPAPAAPPAAEDPTSAPVVDAQVVGAGKARSRPDAAAGGAPARTPSDSPLDAPVITIDARGAGQGRAAKRLHAAAPAPDPEVNTPGAASLVWLNRALPDPTPPSKRLQRAFGRMLVHTADAFGADWGLVYGILRAEGADGRVPASADTVGALSSLLAGFRAQSADDRQAVLAFTDDPQFTDQVLALSHYAHAVGLETLITGLDASQPRLGRRLLADPRVTIYPGGRADVEAGRVNARVLAVIAYLADTFGTVEVTSLISGHRLYARPRVISAHVYGDAVDVAALGGVTILGHQEPGGLTEHAVESLLRLPAEVEPKQIISLLGLGGPSFPLADHYDHIHVGF